MVALTFEGQPSVDLHCNSTAQDISCFNLCGAGLIVSTFTCKLRCKFDASTFSIFLEADTLRLNKPLRNKSDASYYNFIWDHFTTSLNF